MIGDLMGIKWKIFTGIGAVLSIVLGVSLVLAKIEVRHLTKQNKTLTDNVAFLGRENTNLKTTITLQNETIQQKADALAATQRVAEQQLAAAQTARQRAERRAAAALANPPKGDTLEARVLDVDARIMETIK